MFRNERKNEILKILSVQDYVTVAELSKLLYTSESSIRRDLMELEQETLVVRSYGGVELAKSNARSVPFALRLHSRIREKKLMAEKAAALVGEKDIVFLDQSSSALFLAQELFRTRRVTIVTNNLEILCTDQPAGVTVYSTGGRVSGYRRCLIGENATNVFSGMRADFAFFSSEALSPEGSIYDNSLEEVTVKNAMMRNAAKNVFLCDSAKFDKYAGYKQCDLRDIDCLVSEGEIPEKFRQLAPNTQFL